ncbi:SDR family NAD(P)-dependent oxidoreductase [bacterium BFN5]|nr:SDR family NAD(P)-dependent oxidoreductase [bacterium BFN5]
MHLTGNTILLTGGASGVGLALTKRFWKAGNKVIICGRRPDKLMEVEEKYPGVRTKVCDITDEVSRRELYNWVTGTFPTVN